MKSPIIHISIVISILFFVFSCKNDHKTNLCKKWKTVSLKNMAMERQLDYTKEYIDTLGKNDPEFRKLVNLDSVKLLLNNQMKLDLEDQKLQVENLVMEFTKNGIAYNTSIEGVDSAYYSIEGDDIKIDEPKLKGYGETMTFTIMKLSPDSLQLRLVDYGDTSFISMVPVK